MTIDNQFSIGVELDPTNFPAGWHYLQLKMPDSEPLKIARYGSMGTYRIPDLLGGREDVVFIVQTRNEMFPDPEFGGMYVIRPRELGERGLLVNTWVENFSSQ